nr:translation initiation factor IF-2-like [Equus asinus]
MSEDADGARGPGALAAAPGPAAGLWSPWARRGRFLPLHGPLSISRPGRGKNPGDAPRRAICPCYSDRSQARPGQPPFPPRGSGREGRREDPAQGPANYPGSQADRQQLPVSPGLGSSSMPRPHCPACATATRDCSVAAPTERWVQSPGGDEGCAGRQPLPTGGPLLSSPYQTWPQGPKSGLGPQLAKDLSDSRHEARQDERAGGGISLQETLRSTAAILLCPPLQPPTLGWACGAASSTQASTMRLLLPKN